MASTKEIKNRIKSVQDTKKITNAMYLISSTKMRKAKKALDNTRPYFNVVKSEIEKIFTNAPSVESRYFVDEFDENADVKRAYLVVTADKGLAGAYNQNVIKETKRLIGQNEGNMLFVVGEYGRQHFMQRHIDIEQSFLYTAQNPTIDRAREICNALVKPFEEGKVDEIYVIYTDMKNSMASEVVTSRLLPFHRLEFTNSSEEIETEFEFEPSVKNVLENITKSYVSGYVYSALVDSFCSEQNARMTAMNSANQNAESLLANLQIQFNRVRQAGITQEITEVSSGAKAQKKKKKEEVKSR